MASSAAFTASGALFESPGTDMDSKRFLVSSVDLVMGFLLSLGFSSYLIWKDALQGNFGTGGHMRPQP
jgi:hypothetical protein